MALRKLLLALSLTLLPFSGASAAFIVSVYQANTSGIANLATADAIVANSANLLGSFNYDVIEFDDLGDGTRGNFSLNNPFPAVSPPSSFVVTVTGLFSVAADGSYTFGINHDDGARLMIDGNLWASADGVVDNRNTENTGFLSAGLHTASIVFFENFGGASLELYSGTGNARALVQSVPEPSTLAVLGLGLLGFGLARRKAPTA